MSSSAAQLRRLSAAVGALRERAMDLEMQFAADIELIEPKQRDSARNLIHYLAVRQSDIRALQEELSSLGLSSLGRMEAHTMATLSAVCGTLNQLAGTDESLPLPAIGFQTGPLLLQEHTDALLGAPPAERRVRVMVTMPSEAAVDGRITRDLLAAGMNVLRINCAHDGPEAWRAMIEHARAATRELHLPCKILADLPGPKLRTGAMLDGPCVLRLKPVRDGRGRVVRTARLWLADEQALQSDGVSAIRLPDHVRSQLRPGDLMRLTDARGRSRKFVLVQWSDQNILAECDRTSYLENGTVLEFERVGVPIASATVDGLPPTPGFIPLTVDQRLLVTLGPDPGRPEQRDANGRVVTPATITCALPEVFKAVKAGEPIFFDDGKIEGRVVQVTDGRIEVKIIKAPPDGAKLRAEKGINLPETYIDTPLLSAGDIEALTSLSPFVDMVGLSFVRGPRDVEQLQQILQSIGAQEAGIVLKIENRLAFERLPSLLLTAMRSPRVGVMLARGDLAVEVGYERLSEVQEEILWICEAAHVPVIWATQVLEDLANTGVPSRSEVTDAAMSGRAECVMLNKGPHVAQAVQLLSAILDRMEEHQSKKSAMMRELSISKLL